MAKRNSKGQFQTGNPGKPKGSTNKITGNFREQLTAAADNYGLIDTLFADLAELSPPDRVRAITAIMPYLLPKLSTVDIESNSAGALPPIIFVQQAPDD